MGEWWQDRTYRSLEIQRIRGDEMYEVGKDRRQRKTGGEGESGRGATVE